MRLRSANKKIKLTGPTKEKVVESDIISEIWRCKRNFFEPSLCELDYEQNILQSEGWDTKTKCKTACKSFVSKTKNNETRLSSFIDLMMDKLHSDDYKTSLIAVKELFPITIKHIPTKPGIQFTLDTLIDPSERLKQFITREQQVFSHIDYKVRGLKSNMLGYDDPTSLMPVYTIVKENNWINNDMSYQAFYTNIFIPFVNTSQNVDKFDKVLKSLHHPWGKANSEWNLFVNEQDNNSQRHRYIASLSCSELRKKNIFMIMKVSFSASQAHINMGTNPLDIIMSKLNMTREEALDVKNGQMCSDHFSISRTPTIWLCSQLFPKNIPKSMSNTALLIHSLSATIMYQLYPNIRCVEISMPLSSMEEILQKGSREHGYIVKNYRYFFTEVTVIPVGIDDHFRDIWCKPLCNLDTNMGERKYFQSLIGKMKEEEHKKIEMQMKEQRKKEKVNNDNELVGEIRKLAEIDNPQWYSKINKEKFISLPINTLEYNLSKVRSRGDATSLVQIILLAIRNGKIRALNTLLNYEMFTDAIWDEFGRTVYFMKNSYGKYPTNWDFKDYIETLLLNEKIIDSMIRTLTAYREGKLKEFISFKNLVPLDDPENNVLDKRIFEVFKK